MEDRIKQVIIVRNDLKMPKGKLAAQVAHASLGAVLTERVISPKEIMIPSTADLHAWITGSFFKVVLKVDSKEELCDLYVKAKTRGIPCVKIIDAGHTVFNGTPTLTCIGIGPAKSSILDTFTGDLKLL